ncbi:MAG: nuclear transport factor 2 family protein [Dehalococcoidia bacterium]|nr:nuclear transport factor 2 family protein [Dehalococcoidia bacterium]
MTTEFRLPSPHGGEGPGVRVPDPGTEAEVLAAQRARFDATTRADVAALDALLADDCTYVHAHGVVDTKAAFLATIEAGRTRYASFATRELAVRVLGGVALVTGLADIDVRAGERALTLRVRFLDVWERRDGRWQNVAWQPTRLPDA